MISATEFVAAGSILAALSALLPVVGASVSDSSLTEPRWARTAAIESSPDTEAELQQAPEALVKIDILPGISLIVEEVEPGVYRVVSDGYRDLARSADGEDFYLGGILDDSIAAGLDGSVWWFGRDGFFRLGDPASYGWAKSDPESRVFASDDFEVAPDGTLWRSKPESGTVNAVSFDGQTWIERRKGGSVAGIEVQDDGTVWTAWRNKNRRVKVGRLTSDGWAALPGGAPSADRSASQWTLSVATRAGGDIWLIGRDLRRHDGNGWERIATPGAGGGVERADVGPDGTLWVRLQSGVSTLVSTLARFDGVDWLVYDQFRGIPGMGDHYQGFEGWFEVAPDGSVWFNPIGDFARTGTECDGVANFDGESLTNYLRDTCIYAMDVAPDGSVWVQAGEPFIGQGLDNGLVETYVIRPLQAALATG